MQRFPVRESFTVGITDPGFNDPAASGFNAALLPHDLTRGGVPFAAISISAISSRMAPSATR